MQFEYERLPTLDAVRASIQSCEGRHVQQAIYSTFMDALTQVCFTCQKIRGHVDWEANRSYSGPPQV